MYDILFEIPLWGGRMLPIHTYGVMAMFGFLFGLLVARWNARKAGIAPDSITDIALYALMAGVIGARLFFVIQTKLPLSKWLAIWEGGLVFYGGFIGGLVVTLYLVWRRRLRLLQVFDVLAPAIALGHAFGRMGCFLRGCCYGRPVHEGAWYGVQFPNGALAYRPYGEFPEGAHLFPAQLMESIGLLIIFVILLTYFRRRRIEGSVGALYLILYPILRFCVEIFRGDTHAPGHLSIAQFLSIGIFFGGLLMLVTVRGRAPAQVNGRLTKAG